MVSRISQREAEYACCRNRERALKTRHNKYNKYDVSPTKRKEKYEVEKRDVPCKMLANYEKASGLSKRLDSLINAMEDSRMNLFSSFFKDFEP